MTGVGDIAEGEDALLAGLDAGGDRQQFRGLLRRLATHATATDPVPGSCAAAGPAAC